MVTIMVCLGLVLVLTSDIAFTQSAVALCDLVVEQAPNVIGKLVN